MYVPDVISSDEICQTSGCCASSAVPTMGSLEERPGFGTLVPIVPALGFILSPGTASKFLERHLFRQDWK